MLQFTRKMTFGITERICFQMSLVSHVSQVYHMSQVSHMSEVSQRSQEFQMSQRARVSQMSSYLISELKSTWTRYWCKNQPSSELIYTYFLIRPTKLGRGYWRRLRCPSGLSSFCPHFVLGADLGNLWMDFFNFAHTHLLVCVGRP